MSDKFMKDEPDSIEGEKQEVRPGRRSEMGQKPRTGENTYKGSGKLKGKTAIITGGDSGIGRAVAVAYAKEGANIVMSYLNEDEDAAQTKELVEQLGVECIAVSGDVGEESVCEALLQVVQDKYDQVDVLVNNAGEQHPQQDILDITKEQLERTFRTNIFSIFYMVKAALPYMKEGGVIINTSSVTAYKGHPILLDYSATKGAIVALTRSLALSLADKKIRVNSVAPGPIWTPLIPSTFTPDQVKNFGKDVPLGRPGQPEELAPAYVFLASDDSSYITGQTIHVNGGSIVNS